MSKFLFGHLFFNSLGDIARSRIAGLYSDLYLTYQGAQSFQFKVNLLKGKKRMVPFRGKC